LAGLKLRTSGYVISKSDSESSVYSAFIFAAATYSLIVSTFKKKDEGSTSFLSAFYEPPPGTGESL
jgi:hypothetical protein